MCNVQSVDLNASLKNDFKIYIKYKIRAGDRSKQKNERKQPNDKNKHERKQQK